MSFWGELKRRNVFKVGAAYLIAAWLILQVASITFPALNLPAWALTLVTVFLIIGFVIAIILAWAYEVTPDGVKLTKKVPLADSITHVTGRKLNYVLVGVIVLAFAYILFDHFYLDRRVTMETQVATTVAEQTSLAVDVKEASKTVAVLPFDDLSPEKDQEYFVAGLSEEILNSLAKIPDLLVTAKTSSFAFKDTGKTVQEIAEVLGVAHILEGSVRKAGDALRITVQLIRASDGFHLWSETYNRELKDIFAVQEDIAIAVADELKVTLGIGRALKPLGGTNDLEAYEHYLYAQGLWSKTAMDEGEIIAKINGALESVDTAIAIDPEFALAWAYKALIHAYLSIFGPVNQTDSQREAELRAVQRAIEIEPNLPEGHYMMGAILGSKGELIAAESELRKAFDLKTQPVSWNNEGVMVTHYLSTGYFAKAQELIEKMVQNDPLNLEVRGFYLYSFGILGDMDRAEKEYERGRALFGDKWNWGNRFISKLRLSTGKPLTSEDIPIFENNEVITSVAKAYFESPEEGIAALRRLYDDYPDEITSRHYAEFSLWAAYFGDSQFLMNAMEKIINIKPMDMFLFWAPLFREVWNLPRFKELIREIGLVDYWNEFGWPDICRPLDNGDFECD